jgi:hypothetical protein
MKYTFIPGLGFRKQGQNSEFLPFRKMVMYNGQVKSVRNTKKYEDAIENMIIAMYDRDGWACTIRYYSKRFGKTPEAIKIKLHRLITKRKSLDKNI